MFRGRLIADISYFLSPCVVIRRHCRRLCRCRGYRGRRQTAVARTCDTAYRCRHGIDARIDINLWRTRLRWPDYRPGVSIDKRRPVRRPVKRSVIEWPVINRTVIPVRRAPETAIWPIVIPICADTTAVHIDTEPEARARTHRQSRRNNSCEQIFRFHSRFC